MVQRFFQVSSLDVFQKMQQPHADLIELIDWLPARSQNGEAYISVFVNVGVKDLVEALNLWRFEGVFLSGLEGEGNLRVPVIGPVLIGDDLDVEVSDALVGEGDGHIINSILTVLLDVDLHALLDGLEVSVALIFEFLLSDHSFFLEVLEHK